MKVGIQARLKNGVLWEAAKRLGSQSELARHLGLSIVECNGWVNLQRCPDFDNPKRAERYAEIERKLLDLTGLTLDEIFPQEIRGKAFQKRQQRIDAIVEMPIQTLVAAGAVPQLPPAPEDIVYNEERGRVVDHVIESLDTPRYEKVIRMRFGLPPYDREHTLEEVGDELGVSRGRVQQIETNALRMLRRPSRSKQLKQVLV